MKKKKRETRKQQVVQPKLQSKREKEICLKKEKDRKIKYKIIKEERELNKKKEYILLYHPTTVRVFT